LFDNQSYFSETLRIQLTSKLPKVESELLECMKLDLGDAASISDISDYGGLAIHEAALQGDEEAVRLLVSSGVEVDEIGEGQATPLHCACRSPLGEGCVRVLVEELGGAIDPVDAEGKTPLHRCAEVGLCLGATVLLARGAFVDARDLKGDTPLHIACRAAHTELKTILLAYGADSNCRNKSGDKAFELESPQDLREAAGQEVDTAAFDLDSCRQIAGEETKDLGWSSDG